jgi:hypothetical protein
MKRTCIRNGRRHDEPGWVMLSSPDGGAGLSFQTGPDYVPPVWPADLGDPAMMVHLDIGVEDLEMAGARAQADEQPWSRGDAASGHQHAASRGCC